MPKRRGVTPGCPDNWILHHGRLVTIEMKSPGGRVSAAQRSSRESLLRAGAQWWEFRSARAAMWASCKSRVRFRVIVHEDGTLERWQQPKLEPWEVPRRDPSELRPQHPDVVAKRRERQQSTLRPQQSGALSSGKLAQRNIRFTIPVGRAAHRRE
jgi:hypothetical protein